MSINTSIISADANNTAQLTERKTKMKLLELPAKTTYSFGNDGLEAGWHWTFMCKIDNWQGPFATQGDALKNACYERANRRFEQLVLQNRMNAI